MRVFDKQKYSLTYHLLLKWRDQDEGKEEIHDEVGVIDYLREKQHNIPSIYTKEELFEDKLDDILF